MAGIKITEGITQEHLADIYSDPYILRVGHDHRPAEYINHPHVMYFSAWVDNRFAGAFMAIESGWIEWDLHSFLKKSFVKNSRKLGAAFIDHVFALNPNLLRVTAYVMEGLESAKNYCTRLGFKQEGVRRCAYMVGGKPKSCYILGLLRSEWVA